MTFTANAAATAHTISYSSKAVAGAAATATADAYTVYATGGRPVEIRVSVERKTARTHALPTSIPSAVDPLSSRASGSTLAAATGSKRGKRAATSQWDL
jgi:hypothetical protein